MSGNNDDVIRLMTELKDSLERQMNVGFHQTHAQLEAVNARLDGIEARLDRQGGWLRGGQTNLVRLNDWSEDVDKLISELSKRVTELERRKDQGPVH